VKGWKKRIRARLVTVLDDDAAAALEFRRQAAATEARSLATVDSLNAELDSEFRRLVEKDR
jgi:hypothetical protein